MYWICSFGGPKDWGSFMWASATQFNKSTSNPGLGPGHDPGGCHSPRVGHFLSYPEWMEWQTWVQVWSCYKNVIQCPYRTGVWSFASFARQVQVARTYQRKRSDRRGSRQRARQNAVEANPLEWAWSCTGHQSRDSKVSKRQPLKAWHHGCSPQPKKVCSRYGNVGGPCKNRGEISAKALHKKHHSPLSQPSAKEQGNENQADKSGALPAGCKAIASASEVSTHPPKNTHCGTPVGIIIAKLHSGKLA